MGKLFNNEESELFTDIMKMMRSRGFKNIISISGDDGKCETLIISRNKIVSKELKFLK